MTTGGEQALDLLVTVTFNDNQLRAHIEPLIQLPNVRSVTVVSDRAGATLPKVTFITPPRLLQKTIGRAVAKLVVCLQLARGGVYDSVFAYHLLPHGLNAAVVSRLTGVPAVYHTIGGPVEWQGGGWKAMNRVLGRIPFPIPLLERLLLRVIRSFRAVVALGPNGAESLRGAGIAGDRIWVISPSVDTQRFTPTNSVKTAYDVVTVSALVPVKRVDLFIQAIALLRRQLPDFRAAIAGVGPLEASVRQLAERLGCKDAIDFIGFRTDIEALLQDARMFALTSRYESDGLRRRSDRFRRRRSAVSNPPRLQRFPLPAW